ncbi:hypothetical protein Taro_027217 [Colocasia esculenta]|uniref:Uncharacterized protein n=1 Tax=Colocasia esculenta TaxID=4460 RepID=A0A843VN16_COLES|nr:hypothetical protein [Colocasia esculenta]
MSTERWMSDVEVELAAPVSLKLPTGSEEWLGDHRTRGVAKLREETSRRGAILVGARGGLGVNQEIVGGSSVKSRVGPEMKQDLLLFSWSWRPGVAVDRLASRLVDVDCLNLAAVDVDAKGGGCCWRHKG